MKTYYAVIDTNVLVSALFGKDSIPGEIIKYVRKDIIIPLIGEDILKEYCDVLFRNKFPFKTDEVEDLINVFKTKGLMLNATKTKEIFNDKDDIIFYEIVMTGREMYGDAYLVTGNWKDFPKKPFVVMPKQMVEIIKKGK